MGSFEDVGRAVDREVTKLREFLKAEVKPATERQLIAALRAASKHLGELAEKLEAHGARPARRGE